MSDVHRMTDQQIPRILSLLASSGGTARTPESWHQDRMTALLLGREPQSVMPIACRTIRTCPGRELNVGWLSSNQFAGRMMYRRRTRDSTDKWPALLPELDALLVIRRDEMSRAGRWYQHTGFREVLSIRCLYLDMDAPPDGSSDVTGDSRHHVHVVTPAHDAWHAWQPHMLRVYEDVYAATGGAPLRHGNYWAPPLAHHYYRDHYQFQVLGLWTSPPTDPGAALLGYAVVGWSGWHSKRPRMDVLELATRKWNTTLAAELIATTCRLAWSRHVRQIRAVVSTHDPYRGHLARSGFADRWGYVMMAKWLAPQRFLDRLSSALPPEAADLHLQLLAPGQVPLMLSPRNPGPPVGAIALHGDVTALTRLLLNRTEIASSLQDGTLVSVQPLSDSGIARLSLAFPWTPWVFHMLDYI